MGVAGVPPAVNQVQFSPFKFRRRLLEHCEGHGVALEAYSPLGAGRHLRHESVRQLAQRVGRSPAQVLLRWAQGCRASSRSASASTVATSSSSCSCSCATAAAVVGRLGFVAQGFYNRVRRHSTLGMLAPLEFENTTRRNEDLASPLRGSNPPTRIVNNT